MFVLDIQNLQLVLLSVCEVSLIPADTLCYISIIALFDWLVAVEDFAGTTYMLGAIRVYNNIVIFSNEGSSTTVGDIGTIGITIGLLYLK